MKSSYVIGGVALICAGVILAKYRHSIKDTFRSITAKKGEMKYFTINELTYSSTAVRLGIRNTPNLEQTENLRQLAIHMLDPIREEYGHPIAITSGFRSPELNAKLGGSSKSSQHMLGCAADLVPADNSGTVDDIFKAAIRVGGFDQLIIEQNSSGSKWCHVSWKKSGNRRQILASNNGGASYVDITNQYV